MAIAINGSGTVTGISVGGLPDGIVDTDMLASSVALGITEVDMWRVHTTWQGGANPITSNWERFDSNGEGKLGTGMTESSGVFSFPSTGFWQIDYHSNFYSGTDYGNVIIYLKTSIDSGSNYTYNSDGYSDVYFDSGNGYQSADASVILDVTNTSTFKVTFGVSDKANVYFVGNSGQNQTYAIFTKLAET